MTAYAEALAIIERHLASEKLSDGYKRHEKYNIPRFAVMLCEELHSWIGRDDVSLDSIVLADAMCSGSVDYASKMALTCSMLREREATDA